MNEKLPELTDEERVAMERCDVSEILGTWEERFHCAKNAALRWFRERNELRTQLAAAEARIAELESRPIKNIGQIVREFSECTEPAKKEVGDE